MWFGWFPSPRGDTKTARGDWARTRVICSRRIARRPSNLDTRSRNSDLSANGVLEAIVRIALSIRFLGGGQPQRRVADSKSGKEYSLVLLVRPASGRPNLKSTAPTSLAKTS